MKFHEFPFQKKLFISCIILNSLLLAGFSLFFYYYSANSLRENMRSTLSGSAAMIQTNLDTFLNDADNTLKELQLNTTLLDTARNIPEGENNYLPTHITARFAFQDRFRTALISSDLDISLNYVSKYYDHLGIFSPNGTRYTEKSVLENNANLTSVMDNINYFFYIPPHKDYWGYNRTVISVVRSMRDIYHQYGLLVADFDMDTLTSQLLSDFDTPEDYDIPFWTAIITLSIQAELQWIAGLFWTAGTLLLRLLLTAEAFPMEIYLFPAIIFLRRPDGL